VEIIDPSVDPLWIVSQVQGTWVCGYPLMSNESFRDAIWNDEDWAKREYSVLLRSIEKTPYQ
jgi:hypothetical protein